MFILSLVLCLACGLGFAAIAAWLMSRRGNTIRDILASDRQPEALRIEVADKLKISTNVPTVALYVIAAIVAIALPAYLAWLDRPLPQSKTVLLGGIDGYLGLVGPGEKIYAYPPEMAVRGDGNFSFPLRNGDKQQSVLFESPKTYPVTLTIIIKPDKKQLEVSTDPFWRKTYLIPIQDTFAKLPAPIEISPVPSAHEQQAQNTPTPLPPVTAEMASLPPISGGDQ